MRLSEKQQDFTRDICRLIAKADELGIGLTLGEGYRSEDQQYLYYHGLTIEEGMLANTARKSWTMDSGHLKRLAIDFNHFINGGKDLTWEKEDLQELGDFWESLHPDNTWGGNWSKNKIDVPHYERKL